MNNIQTAVFGGGCFWCTEAIFSRLKGVLTVLPGYTGGQTKNPTYEEVSRGTTGHAEATRVEYDSTIVSYDTLLEIFFSSHDPTSLNRQGNDVGTQYRSAIFYTNEEQKLVAENFIKNLTVEEKYKKPIVTTLEPLAEFYPAENYHQKYYESHKNQPYCRLVIAPKIKKLEKNYSNKLN